jgi:hypothetical protein
MKILTVQEICNLPKNRFKAYKKKINGVKHGLCSDDEYLIKTNIRKAQKNMNDAPTKQ